MAMSSWLDSGPLAQGIREAERKVHGHKPERFQQDITDHIGFEIKNLEAFTKKLEADGIKLDVAYRTVPALNIAIAFIKDPWGTNIELTEGLDQVQ